MEIQFKIWVATLINVKSNHPPKVLKALPESISTRINSISSNKQIFDNASPYYNDALSASGFKEKIGYKPVILSFERRRMRNVIWFNSPFSANVKTNIAKKFLKLIDTHFPKKHRLHKIFNRNNVKVSYSCLSNVRSIITSHNKKILDSKEPESNTKKCNCRQPNACPLNGKCLEKNIIYNCNVKSDNLDPGVNYIGLTEHTFKDRWYKHRNSFKYENKANSTELSKYIWELKNSNIMNPVMTWTILDHAKPHVNGSSNCDLCLTEKYHIINSHVNIINKRSELITKCRHENKFYLLNYKEVPPDNW